MKKETYEAKLATLIVTDATTVAELKIQAKTRAELNRFWMKATTAWFEKNIINQPYKEWVAGWREAKFEFDLKPTGTVRIQQYSCDEWVGAVASGEVIKVSKKELLS